MATTDQGPPPIGIRRMVATGGGLVLGELGLDQGALLLTDEDRDLGHRNPLLRGHGRETVVGTANGMGGGGAAHTRRTGTGATGILLVLKCDIPWELLSQEMDGGSGMTCRRRLRDWQEAGVWERLRKELLHRVQRADQLDWSRTPLLPACLAEGSGMPGQALGYALEDRILGWPLAEGHA